MKRLSFRTHTVLAFAVYHLGWFCVGVSVPHLRTLTAGVVLAYVGGTALIYLGIAALCRRGVFRWGPDMSIPGRLVTVLVALMSVIAAALLGERLVVGNVSGVLDCLTALPLAWLGLALSLKWGHFQYHEWESD